MSSGKCGGICVVLAVLAAVCPVLLKALKELEN